MTIGVGEFGLADDVGVSYFGTGELCCGYGEIGTFLKK